GQPVGTAVLVPQLIFGIPQYMGLNLVLGLGAYDDSMWEWDADPQIAMLSLLAPAMMGTAMTVHGVATAVGDDLQPYRVVGVATVTGINLPFSSIIFGSAMVGRWSPPLIALVQVATTTPATMGSVFAAAEDEPDRVGWALLASWSALQLAHGVTSLILSDDYDSFETYGRDSERRDDDPVELWAGPSLIVHDDGSRAPGLVLGGRF
ncbi:MAG: hypothetical protein JRI68_34955, partial [Deltaproteobacteria bacterium]|nr:hypothetical protein [Deltaproteobacteria bacterium]